ncbi:ABC transporter permease [Tabrizicola sp.]|uniref:ABC transporter permease n=1 Tax=Tabrizicola sp. TaxID=2005166 RepID=UPI002FDE5D6B
MSFRAGTPAALKWGLAILLLHGLMAVLGPFLAPYAQDQMMAGLPIQGASLGHPFGTDQMGRDIFSRALAGGWIVIGLSVAGTVLGVLLGSAMGLFSGTVGGWPDEVLMRLTEAFLAIPFLIFALLIVSLAGPGLQGSPWLLIGVVAAVYLPRVARMSRAAALDVVARDYVLAARLRGEGAWTISRREVLPNAMGVLLVEFAVRAGYAPILVGTLGFLGFGLKPPTPEWGLMMAEYRNLLTTQPMAVFGPGLMLATLVVGLNLFTEGLSAMASRGSAGRTP